MRRGIGSRPRSKLQANHKPPRGNPWNGTLDSLDCTPLKRGNLRRPRKHLNEWQLCVEFSNIANLGLDGKDVTDGFEGTVDNWDQSFEYGNLNTFTGCSQTWIDGNSWGLVGHDIKFASRFEGKKMVSKAGSIAKN
jgi:hypothetical protein